MEHELQEIIAGSYRFSRNVLIVVISDLLDHGAPFERIQNLIGTLEKSNGTSLSGAALAQADKETSYLLAMAQEIHRQQKNGAIR